MPSIEALQRLLDADPRDAFVLYGLAQEHAKAGRHAVALGFYDRCLAVDPAYCYAYYHKARAQLAAGDAAGAGASVRAGVAAAEAAGDAHALSELSAFASELEEM